MTINTTKIALGAVIASPFLLIPHLAFALPLHTAMFHLVANAHLAWHCTTVCVEAAS